MQRTLGPNGSPIPVSVLTGFLGSGKTTLLARFLRHPGMAGTVVIMNEFGEIGLDHDLLQAPEDEIILLNNGCLCCAVLGDLITTIVKLFDRRDKGEIPAFDRIAIETSGLADPAPILQTLISEPEVADLIRLNSVVAVVDAVNASSQIDRHLECVKQIAVADRIVLSKSDLSTPETVQAFSSQLAKLNPGARIWPVVSGDVGPDVLFRDGSSARDSNAVLIDWMERFESRNGRADAPGSGHHHHDHDHDHSDDAHSHTSQVHSYSFWREGPIHPEALEIWLDQIATFRGPNLLRVKGILNVEHRPIVVHAVQHLFHPVEELVDWPSDERRSRIVVIVHGISREAVEATLPLLAFRPQRQGRSKTIDAATFQQFSAAMRGLSRLDV